VIGGDLIWLRMWTSGLLLLAGFGLHKHEDMLALERYIMFVCLLILLVKKQNKMSKISETQCNIHVSLPHTNVISE